MWIIYQALFSSSVVCRAAYAPSPALSGTLIFKDTKMGSVILRKNTHYNEEQAGILWPKHDSKHQPSQHST